MNKHQENVKEFMLKTGQTPPDKPSKIDAKTARLRIALIREELHELSFALGYNPINEVIEIDKQDLIASADAIGDLLYVVYGAAVAMGIDIELIFEEIHRSNMSKFTDGYKREDGKWIKGPNHSKPNLFSIIEKQKNG